MPEAMLRRASQEIDSRAVSPDTVSLGSIYYRFEPRAKLPPGFYEKRNPFFSLNHIIYFNGLGNELGIENVYSSRGIVVIELDTLYKFAERYNKGLTRNSKEKIEKWVNWVSQVDKEKMPYVGEGAAFAHSVEERKIIELWHGLVADRVAYQAALSHLNLNEALYLKFFGSHSPISHILLRLMEIASMAYSPILSSALILTDGFDTIAMNALLQRKIDRKKRELLKNLGPQGVFQITKSTQEVEILKDKQQEEF